MTVHRYYEAKAGPWVAYRDEPKRQFDPMTKTYVEVPGETKRCYIYNVERGTGMLGSPEKCDRFDTKTEALAAARAKWPYKVKGCRIGAERVG